ncbi:MAG TPA: hypothetical protein VGH09_07600, partial [Solirubrobacteraceae bacterium]
MGGRLSLLIGDRRGLVVALAACSILSGLTEAATLAMLAQLATSVVGGAQKAAAHNPVLSLINLHISIGNQILITLGLAVARLFFQIPLSVLPARIAADVMSRMRLELFDAFSRASWTVQSAGSEGSLQEVMTNQVSQAIGGVAGTTGVLTSSLQFTVLMVGAFYLNVVAAVAVGAMTVVLFGFLRPMRLRGGRYAQALSASQISYARNIAESNRVAEESQVFGTGGALRQRLAGVVARS